MTIDIPDQPRTLAEKVWDDHLVVKGENGEPDLIYIDLHLVHEVTSPQAFDGLRAEGPPAAAPRPHDRDRGSQHSDARHRQADRRPDQPHPDRDAAPQRRGVRRAPALARRQGAGHRARRRPAAGPDHAGHHRRLRRLATPRRTARSARWPSASARARSSTSWRPRRCRSSPSRRWRSPSRATLKPGVTAKDIILAVIAKIGTGGGQGYVLEFRGSAIRALSMEGRMTICNMSIEAGARAGMVAPDETTFAYLEGPAARSARARTGRMPSPTGAPFPPTRAPSTTPRSSSTRTSSSPSSRGARTPARACRSATSCPRPTTIADPNDRAAAERALEYMDLDARARR